MADLTTNFCGVSLRNPIVAAPAGTTETADRLKRCDDAGFGAGVIKSYFQFELGRHHPTPRFKILRHNMGRDRSFALYSFEQANIYGLDEFGEAIRKAKAECEMAIFGSINCNTPERWAEAAAVCEQAGADAIELNVSCPHGTHMMARLDMTKTMADAVDAARAGVKHTPLIPKIPGQLDDPCVVAHGLAQAGADGLVMFNRFTGMDVDIATERPVMHGGYAGHGGPWMIHFVMRWISQTYPGLPIPIAASGGVSSGTDVVKLLLCGATTVQTCTAMILGGYDVVGTFLRDLQAWMDAKGYETIDQFRGKICDRILKAEQVDRVGRMVASIDAQKCVNCGLCGKVCIYNAPRPADNVYVIPQDACDGCGLCPEVCPTAAIHMVELAQPRTFTLGVK